MTGELARFLYTVFSILLLCDLASAQAGDASQYRLRGNAASVRVEVSRIISKKGKPVESSRTLFAEYQFDVAGRLIESFVRNYNGSRYMKYRAVYDSRGNKMDETYSGPQGDIVSQTSYSYDGGGRLSGKTTKQGRSTQVVNCAYAYDENGRMSEKVARIAGSDRGLKLVYKYDDQKTIEEIGTDLEGAAVSRTIYRSDFQARLSGTEAYDDKGASVWKLSSTYDDAGNVAEQSVIASEGVNKWRYDYETDSTGNWVKRVTYSLASAAGPPHFEPVEAMYRVITYRPGNAKPPETRPDAFYSILTVKETSSYLSAHAIKREQPPYPEKARRQSIEANVRVFVVIDETGRVIAARPAAGSLQPFGDAATAAIWNWEFSPTLSAGIPVVTVGPIGFDFHF